MRNVLICGYYGFKNMGDEALLKSVAKLFAEIDENISVEALSYNVKYTEEAIGVKGFSRKSIFKLIQKIWQVDCVVFGGGSLLQDITSSKSLLYYLGIIGIAKFFGKPVAIIANGFGPVNNEGNQRLVRWLLNRVDAISVRDEGALEKMRSIGINREITLSSDITFLMEGYAKPLEEKNKVLGISLRPWHFDKRFLEEVAKFGDMMADKGYEIRFYPMKQPDDEKVSSEVMHRMEAECRLIKGAESPEEILRHMTDCQIFVGMRLHGLIFATNLGIPSVAIEYDPKVASFSKEADIFNAGRFDYITAEKLLEGIEKIEGDLQGATEKTLEKRSFFKEKAGRNKKLIKTLINKY